MAGVFNLRTGAITAEYCEALQPHGLRSFMGNDAWQQPGDLQDLMLHETAVSWLSERLKRTLPRREWEETEAGFTDRLKAACQHINEHFDVDALCRELPCRVQNLIDLDGDGLPK